jgi:hypothetical protein
MATQRVVFPIGSVTVPVLVAFVGCHVHHGAHRGSRAYRFQEVHQAHYVGVEGGGRFAVAATHQWLGGEMKHDLRFEPTDCLEHRGGISQIHQCLVQR